MSDQRAAFLAGELIRRIVLAIEDEAISEPQRQLLSRAGRDLERFQLARDVEATQADQGFLDSPEREDDEEEEEREESQLQDQEEEEDLGPEGQGGDLYYDEIQDGDTDIEDSSETPQPQPTPPLEPPTQPTPDPSDDDDEDEPIDVETDTGPGLLSQIADEFEDEAVQVGAGEATQIEEDSLDVDRGRQQLEDLRDAVVAFLRSIGNDPTVVMPPGSQSRIREFLRRLRPFGSASELARRMSVVLDAVLSERTEVEPTPDPAPPSAVTEPIGPSDTPDAPEPRFVGRASDIVRRRERQSFLLFEPPSVFTWITLEGIRRDPSLLRILDVYNGPKGPDPSGRGFVVEILEATGPPQRRRYKPRWQTEPWVPLTAAEDGWYAKSQLVGTARDLAGDFDRRDAGEGGDGDTEDEEDDAAGDDEVRGETQVEQVDGGGRRGGGALVFDASSGRPKLSLRQAFRSLEGGVDRWMIDAVVEYTLNRRFALDYRVPPADGRPGAPTAAELEQLGKDLFAIDKIALVGAFRRERIQIERDRALADEDADDDDDFEADEERALEAWKEDREREFREAAVDLWEVTRREQAADRAALDAQLTAIRLIEAATDSGADPSAVLAQALSDGVSAEAVSYLEPWAEDPADTAWVRRFRRPGLKLPQIRDFLSQPSRSAIAKGYLQLLRDTHSAATKRERQTGIYGSIYGSRWPARPTPTTTPPDHVLPQNWYTKGTKTLIESGDPGQLPNSVALSLLSENSGKGDLPLGHFQMEAETRAQGLYYTKVSVQKRARMAKLSTSMFCLYPLITDRKSAAGIGGFGNGGSGVSWYARAWTYGPLKELARRQSTDFERRINLITLAVPRWGVGDPITFEASALDSDMEKVVERRMRGSDGLSRLVDEALRVSVLAPPV
jgi:hypothetical protein